MDPKDLLPPPPWEGPPIPIYLQKRVFYYGVSAKDVPSILREGVKVEKTRWKRIFLTRTPSYAADYGDVVLEVRLPRHFPISRSMMGEYMTYEDIPPESIRVKEALLPETVATPVELAATGRYPELDRAITERNMLRDKYMRIQAEGGAGTRTLRELEIAETRVIEEWKKALGGNPRPTNPQPSSLSEERKGLCYELAWRWLLKHKEGTLVHGVVFAGEPLSWINHAWVELDDEVYEPQNDETFSKTAFYQAFQAKPAQRYTLLEATKMALRTRNYGPWSGPEIQDILGRATLLAKGWKGER